MSTWLPAFILVAAFRSALVAACVTAGIVAPPAFAQAATPPTPTAATAATAATATTATTGTPTATVQRAQRVAVYDIEPGGVDERLARVLTDAVTEEVRKLDGVAVVGMSEIRAMLSHEAERQLAGCAEDSCVADIANALGVDALVIGSLAAVGTDWVFLLKRIDQQEAATKGSFTVRAAAEDEETLLASIGPAIEQTFPDRPLRAGAVRGVSDRIAKRLHPPPLPRPLFFGTLATTAVLAVGATVLTAPALLFYSSYDDYRTDPANKKAYDLHEHNERGATAQWFITAAMATWIATGAAGLITGVMLPFTSFEPDAEPDETSDGEVQP